MTATARSILCSIRDSGRCWETTQVLAVPTAAERAGQDIVKYPDGSTDLLQVPVNPAIAAVLARYSTPQPSNRPRMVRETYAAPSNVNTDTDQFFYPHRSERWSKRTIVWSIQLRQSDGTDNKS